MGNVAVLGACVRLLLPDGLGFLEEAIAARMGRRAEANLVAAREGYAQCTKQRTIAGDLPVDAEADSGPASDGKPPVFSVSRIDSLLNHTGSWSMDRPVFTDKCTACALCALFCPEGVIARNGEVDVRRLPLLQRLRHL